MPAYFLAVSITLLVWVSLFLYSHHTRKQMVITGGLLTPFAVLDVLTTPSYWNPVTMFDIPVGIEGFLFTFFIAGIASVVYKVFFKQTYTVRQSNIASGAILIIPTAIALAIVSALRLNIIYLFIFGFILMATTMLISRRDLLTNAIFSSLLFGIIYTASFTIWLAISPDSISWWNINNLSGIKLGSIPLEEVFFSLCFGLFVGPLYEYLTSAQLEPTSNIASKN